MPRRGLGRSRGYFIRSSNSKISHSLDPHSLKFFFRYRYRKIYFARFKSSPLATKIYFTNAIAFVSLFLCRGEDLNLHGLLRLLLRQVRLPISPPRHFICYFTCRFPTQAKQLACSRTNARKSSHEARAGIGYK